MKTKSKLLTLLMLATGATATTALINKCIKISATSKHLLDVPQSLCYKWRFGNIHYTKTGFGKPLLLVHDLDFASSAFEWNRLEQKLKDNYTVYSLDLLGCGRSEKPNLTYTNYLYVQLLCDFIKSEIGHRTNIITTGESSALSIMACNSNPELFDRIMLINPNSILNCSQVPSKRAKFYKFILDFPIIGTLLYHIACSRSLIKENFDNLYFSNPFSAKPSCIDNYFESAHLGAYPKAIFSSLKCNYTKCNIINALKKINNSIYIIGGGEIENINELISEYKSYNSAIEYSIISNTKHLPQLESPEKVLDLIKIYFA